MALLTPPSRPLFLFPSISTQKPLTLTQTPQPTTPQTGATYALEKLDGMELGGRPLKIRPAMRKPNNYGGGGGYGGGDGGY
jgi:hypothetical protein